MEEWKIFQEHGACVNSAIIELIQECRCPICLEFMTNPRNAPCQHNFCENCIYEHIKDNHSECPTCRCPGVNKRSLARNNSLSNIIAIIKKLSTTLGKPFTTKLGSDPGLSQHQSVRDEPIPAKRPAKSTHIRQRYGKRARTEQASRSHNSNSKKETTANVSRGFEELECIVKNESEEHVEISNVGHSHQNQGNVQESPRSNFPKHATSLEGESLFFVDFGPSLEIPALPTDTIVLPRANLPKTTSGNSCAQSTCDETERARNTTSGSFASRLPAAAEKKIMATSSPEPNARPSDRAKCQDTQVKSESLSSMHSSAEVSEHLETTASSSSPSVSCPANIFLHRKYLADIALMEPDRTPTLATRHSAELTPGTSDAGPFLSDAPRSGRELGTVSQPKTAPSLTSIGDQQSAAKTVRTSVRSAAIVGGDHDEIDSAGPHQRQRKQFPPCAFPISDDDNNVKRPSPHRRPIDTPASAQRLPRPRPSPCSLQEPFELALGAKSKDRPQTPSLLPAPAASVVFNVAAAGAEASSSGSSPQRRIAFSGGRILGTASPGASNAKHTRSQVQDGTPLFLLTGFSEKEYVDVTAELQRLGARSRRDFDEHVTHVLCKADREGFATRTIKFCQGLLAGIPLLSQSCLDSARQQGALGSSTETGSAEAASAAVGRRWPLEGCEVIGCKVGSRRDRGVERRARMAARGEIQEGLLSPQAAQARPIALHETDEIGEIARR